jgi:uncharacterized membrane protein
MKFLRIVLLLAVLSLAISWLFYYITADTIVASWQSKLGEIGTIGIVIFVFLLIIYIIAKSAVKSALALRKKRPPQNGGPKV